MSSMKAVRIYGYGGVDVLVYDDAPRPIPGADEVLIRVYATSVNPFDCALRAGYMTGYFNHVLPLILGTDVSGVIEEVGANVTAFKPGESIYARAGVVRDGAYAEYVVVPVSDVALKPPSLDHIHAAALPHVILTAWQALIELANLTDGQSILIHAAAGGVGHIAVQLARLRGAKVFGTASINLDLLHTLGVDEAIDYSTTRFEEVVQNVDVVLDTVGGDTLDRSYPVLKRGGTLVSTVQPPSAEKAAEHGIKAHLVSSNPPIGKVLTEVATMVEEGHIKPVVSTVLPLHEMRKAHQLIEAKHMRGKLAIQVVQ